MTKRRIIIGGYDTAAEGLWTLTAWDLSPAKQKTEYISIPGHDGDLDVSTLLTDGVPTYQSRTLSAVFESSEGNRLTREGRISDMVNRLDGYRLDIILPDDPLRYITGRVHVERVYNDLAHGSVRVKAVCDPWRYSLHETLVCVAPSISRRTVSLRNNGRRAVLPLVSVSGGTVRLTVGDSVLNLTGGSYTLPDLYLLPGDTAVTVSGSGTLTVTYREAVL